MGKLDRPDDVVTPSQYRDLRVRTKMAWGYFKRLSAVSRRGGHRGGEQVASHASVVMSESYAHPSQGDRQVAVERNRSLRAHTDGERDA